MGFMTSSLSFSPRQSSVSSTAIRRTRYEIRTEINPTLALSGANDFAALAAIGWSCGGPGEKVGVRPGVDHSEEVCRKIEQTPSATVNKWDWQRRSMARSETEQIDGEQSSPTERRMP
jgi:hypothetical protein